MSALLERKLTDIEDDEILALIRELEEACQLSSQPFSNLPLFLFLAQCVHPKGPEKRISITTKFVAVAPLLESRVGQLPDGPLRDLCGELSLRSNTALDFFSGSKVCVMLNKTLPKDSPAKKPSATQRRWDAVVRQRRSNR